MPHLILWISKVPFHYLGSSIIGKRFIYKKEGIGHIASIDRHYIRPIVRGKESKSVKFGAKVNSTQIDGIFFIEPFFNNEFFLIMKAYGWRIVSIYSRARRKSELKQLLLILSTLTIPIVSSIHIMVYPLHLFVKAELPKTKKLIENSDRYSAVKGLPVWTEVLEPKDRLLFVYIE